MYKTKPVSVSQGAFNFCKYSLSIILLIAFIFKIKWLTVVSFIILILSVILRIKKAPLIFLYDKTLGKIIKTQDEILDEYGMMFAHSLGSIINLVCIIFLYFLNERVGWAILLVFLIIKIISACGYCTGSKLYGCMSKGGCCSFLKKKNG